MSLRFLFFLLAGPLLGASPEPMRLTLEAPIEKWDEAIPLGNGLLGGLLWGKGNEIRLSLDRGDLWDLRQHPIYARSDFNYATVLAHAQSGRTDALNKVFAHPSDFPTKLPGARLVVRLAPEFQARTFALDLQRALGSVDFGAAQAECFFGEASPAALLRVPDPAATFDLVPNPAVTKIGYTIAAVTRTDREVTLVQDAAEGFRYVIHAASRSAEGGTVLAIAITTNREAADPVALARERATTALARGYDAARAKHVQWWEKFWANSSVSLPDAALQQHYNLIHYFYGAASRRGAPPIPLQGLWTADAGVLPPWRGDYHHDLNTQLTYWAYLASGRFDQGLSFLDFMWDLKPRHEQFAREFFGVKRGMIVPGVMALDGRAMGSWFPYTLSPTMGAWVAQAFYWHWRYEMDPRFLADRAYPYCAAIGEALAELLKPDPRSGHLKVPLSSSPEIHNNTQRAWLPPHSNFDHALLQWLFLANAEMATALDRGPEAERWRSLHGRLGPLAVSETGVLLVAPGEALTASHRHHSQLMAIHPLGLIHPDNRADDRRIVDATLADIDRLGTSAWTGYSFSWMAALRARVGHGDEALRFLAAYREHTTSRNGFHLNGVITGSKISNYRGRAFTLEGNFAAAQAVHEMLLQSGGGRLRVFPALPSTWRETSFRDLRAEGGFVVSAEQRDGRLRRVSIRATVPQELRLVDPFAGRACDHNLPITRADGEIRRLLRAGQTLELTATLLPAATPPLDLGARVQPAPLTARFSDPGWHIWCGAPIRGDDGKYHLLYSRWPAAVGFAPGWARHSEIAHAVADRPLGPYKFVNVALPPRGLNSATGKKFWDGDVTHNPNILRHPNGKFYLFYMGNHGDGKDYPMHRNHQRVGVAVADSPAGPWHRFDRPIVDVSADPQAFDSLCVTNPAAAVRPDGGIVLIYKAVQIIPGKPMGGNVRFGAAMAANPEGPYVKTPGRIFEPEASAATQHWMIAEDPFVWFSARDGQRYYAVARDVVGQFTGAKGGLALFQSDDGLQWRAAEHPKVLGAKFAWADGALSNTQLERPALLFDQQGQPIALFGATDGYRKDGGTSFNVHLPLTLPE